MGGWVLKREAGGNEVTYKFHGKLILKAHKTLAVSYFLYISALLYNEIQ